MSNELAAWSYSRYSDYDQCPLRFKLKHIDKIPEPASAAMVRGREIHKEGEMYLLKKGLLTPALEKFKTLLSELAALPHVSPEMKAGFTRAWCKTGYFAKDIWLRAVFDVFVPYEDDTGLIIDFKTGKKYATNHDQVELFALTAMCHAPNLKSVETRLWYLDSGEQEFGEFPASDREALKAKWEAKVAPMFADTVYAPRPNDKCRFCSFAKGKGGQCRFG